MWLSRDWNLSIENIRGETSIKRQHYTSLERVNNSLKKMKKLSLVKCRKFESNSFQGHGIKPHNHPLSRTIRLVVMNESWASTTSQITEVAVNYIVMEAPVVYMHSDRKSVRLDVWTHRVVNEKFHFKTSGIWSKMVYNGLHKSEDMYLAKNFPVRFSVWGRGLCLYFLFTKIYANFCSRILFPSAVSFVLFFCSPLFSVFFCLKRQRGTVNYHIFI